MRTLIVMRHAKSSWKNSLLSDHERPLNRRGIRSADDLGQQLSDTEFEPQIVISSDSTRTTDTWHGMWSHLPRADIRFRRDFYLGGLPDIQIALSEIPTSVERVMVLGHNPGFSLAAGWLSGLHIELKTAYAAILQQQASDWSGVHHGASWALKQILVPRVIES